MGTVTFLGTGPNPVHQADHGEALQTFSPLGRGLSHDMSQNTGNVHRTVHVMSSWPPLGMAASSHIAKRTGDLWTGRDSERPLDSTSGEHGH